MGGGHRSYMREIETIAKKGYMVFAYDHTGCMESGGESPNGFAQSLKDLDCCISTLKTIGKFKGEEITVIGHSWGGFSTQNIMAIHPDLKNVVALSGFSSVKRMVAQHFSGALKPFAKAIYALEETSNPEYVKYDAVESLAKTDVKALIIHSGDDPLVKREFHFDIMRSALKDNISYFATIQFYFCFTNLYATAMRAMNGILNTQILLYAAIGVIGCMAGDYVGRIVFDQLDGTKLKRIIYLGMIISGVLMLI